MGIQDNEPGFVGKRACEFKFSCGAEDAVF
jgi:hypothetical protein